MPFENHTYLYEQLLDTEFTWIDSNKNDIYMDENRASDGLALRHKYCRDCGVDISQLEASLGVDNRCSILEMMVAFARRIESDIMWDAAYKDRTPIWFGYMLYSLRLDPKKNVDETTYSEISVKRKLNKFLRRQYESDGYGGLFYLEVQDWYEVENYFNYISNFNPDMNNTELWQQMGIWTQLYSANILCKHKEIEKY